MRPILSALFFFDIVLCVCGELLLDVYDCAGVGRRVVGALFWSLILFPVEGKESLFCPTLKHRLLLHFISSCTNDSSKKLTF